MLELEPLKKKKLKLILVENEYKVDWWLDPPPKETQDLFANLKFISKEYTEFIDEMIAKYQPNFAVEEKGLRTEDEFRYDNPLVDVFQNHAIPHRMVDISENAVGYISSTLEDRRSLLKSIKKEILALLAEKTRITENNYLQQLVQWGEYLEAVCNEEENEIRFDIREAWMLMGILEFADTFEEKNLTGLFICDKDHFEGISKLADELGVEVVQIQLKKRINNEMPNSNLKELLSQSIYEIMPIKVKAKKKSESILYFFDTDDYASPFDINMAYDAGFNVVVPFSKVTAKSVTKLVQDAIFSRGPKAPTTFFVGGSNVKEGEAIAKKVLKALVPPFEAPVVIDPRGSHTTAAAVVAKTLAMVSDHGIGDLEGKKVVVLGTGPVGRIAAVIAAKLHCKTVLVETWEGASEAAVKDLAHDLTTEAGDFAYKIVGAFATTDEQKFELVKDADVIWSLAAAGIQILSEDLMQKLPPTKIVIDVNAVPPAGIAGLKANHDNKEIYPGIFGTGALALGRVKYETESKILKQAAKTKGKKIFDYNLSFDMAQEILMGKKVTVAS
jgi:methylene-tetrahydromethanopterin dehydrogenase